MTDLCAGFIVALDKDMRDDDVESIITAIQMIRGVMKVTPLIGQPSLVGIYEQRTRYAIRDKLLEFLETPIPL